MMQKKRFFLVSVLLCCLVALLALPCLVGPAMAEGKQTEKSFYQEIKAALELEPKPLYFVAYEGGERGQPVAIIAAPGAMVMMTENDKINEIDTLVKVLRQIQEARKEKFVETTCETSFYVHGSPGCRIKKTASGEYKVICDE